MAHPTQKEGKARKAFAKALKDYAAQQPDHGNSKLFSSSEGSWSLNDIAREIEQGTKKGKEFYAELKPVVKLEFHEIP